MRTETFTTPGSVTLQLNIPSGDIDVETREFGETLVERAETIHAIRQSHKEFGHVQEVIVQNFRAKDHTAMATVPDTGFDDFVATVAVTRSPSAGTCSTTSASCTATRRSGS